MKTTITIHDYIQSELQKKGLNEFYVPCDNIIDIGSDGKLNFMNKILNYDKDVQDIVNTKLFHQLKLVDPIHDKHFKKTYIMRFLNREIGFQTIEAFATQNAYTYLTMEKYINSLYENYDKYLTNEHMSVNNGKVNSNNVTDTRNATATLPQTEVNVNVDDTILNYADNNTINRVKNRSENSNDNTQVTNNYDVNVLESLFPLFNKIFKTFDKKCFLQIW